MLADIVFVNASMVVAFITWFGVQTLLLRPSMSGVEVSELARTFASFVEFYWLYWSLLALLTFELSGFYTRTRGYASRYKAWIVLRAVTLFMMLLIFSDYLLVRGDLFPRGVAVLGWFFTMATVGGLRFGKDIFLKLYRVQPNRRSSQLNRVLVVGGAGYLGSVLVPKLLACGYNVRVFDSLLFGEKGLAAVKNHPRLELTAGDVRDIEKVVEALKDCDAVVHLAAIVGDPACDVNKNLASEVNRAATQMLIDVSRGYGESRFVFASTCSVYGASDFLVDEHTKPNPVSLYAETKLDCESLLLRARDPGFHPTVLRLGTLFGLSPRPRFDLVVNFLTALASAQGKITIFNGQQWRPFLHVADAARAIVACLMADVTLVSGEIFNVGDYNLNCRLSEISEKIAGIVPAVEVQKVDNADRRNYRVSFDKIHRRLDFVCEKTVDEGIEEIYAAIQTSAISDFRAAEFSNVLTTTAFAKTANSESSSLRAIAMLLEDRIAQREVA
jgi:nucleoside-diphosphate-sugar epimerase